MPAALPPLVLLPGTLCDGRVFAPLLSALHAQFDHLSAAVIMTVDHASLQSAAEHVLAHAPPRFALLGFSLGGILALEIALLAPSRVAGLALLNVNAAPAPVETHAARRAAVSQAAAMGHADYVQRHLWLNYVAEVNQGNAALKSLIATMAEHLGDRAFSNQTEAALLRRDYRPHLPSLSMPVLVLAGEDDAVCPAAAQAELAQAIPHAVFERISGAGHFALLEQQDAVAVSVTGWFHTVAQQFHPVQENQ